MEAGVTFAEPGPRTGDHGGLHREARSAAGLASDLGYLVALANTLADGLDRLPSGGGGVIDVRLARALAMNIIDVLDPTRRS